MVKKNQYKIIAFYSEEDKSVDLNNDGIKNSDIMLEMNYYFDNYSLYDDLEEIRSMRRAEGGKTWETGESFFSFVLPIQYFPPYQEMPPTSFYSFERGVAHMIHLDIDKDRINQSIYISTTKIVFCNLKKHRKHNTKPSLKKNITILQHLLSLNINIKLFLKKM